MKLIYGAFGLLSMVLCFYLYSALRTNVFCRETYFEDLQAFEQCRDSATDQMDQAVQIALGVLTAALGIHAKPKELEHDQTNVPYVRPMPPPDYQDESTTG